MDAYCILPHNAGDPGSIPGSATSPEEGIGYPFQYSGFPGESEGEEATCNADLALLSGLGRCLEEGWHPTPVFLPGESPWTEEPGRLPGSTCSCKESDTTKQHSLSLHILHFLLTFKRMKELTASFISFFNSLNLTSNFSAPDKFQALDL